VNEEKQQLDKEKDSGQKARAGNKHLVEVFERKRKTVRSSSALGGRREAALIIVRNRWKPYIFRVLKHSHKKREGSTLPS